MTVEQMRVALMKAYPGPKWERRVSGMSEAQVIRIYNRLRANNQLR